MKYKIIDHIKKLASSINKFIINYKPNGKRFKDTNFLDGFMYKMMQGQQCMSGPKATYVLNKFKKTKISRISYHNREKDLDVGFYETIYKKICSGFDHLFEYNSKTFVAIDGTQINLNKNLSNQGLSLNKNKLAVNGLVLGIYNVSTNCPSELTLLSDKNERQGFLKYIKDKDHKNNIYLLDRGFFGLNFFSELCSNNVSFVCRIRENLNIINKQSIDSKIVIDGHEIRIISYKIGNMNYYLATNLLDSNEFTIDALKNIYHKRWSIEEFFKFLKQNTDMNSINEKTLDGIKKTLYTHLIVSKLVEIIILIHGPSKKDNTIINKAVLVKAIYDEFLLRFFYMKNMGDKSIRQFIETAIELETTNKGKSNPRTSSIPYTKWYIKKYYHKYLIDGKRKYHSKMALKKLKVKEEPT